MRTGKFREWGVGTFSSSQIVQCAAFSIGRCIFVIGIEVFNGELSNKSFWGYSFIEEQSTSLVKSQKSVTVGELRRNVGYYEFDRCHAKTKYMTLSTLTKSVLMPT